MRNIDVYFSLLRLFFLIIIFTGTITTTVRFFQSSQLSQEVTQIDGLLVVDSNVFLPKLKIVQGGIMVRVYSSIFLVTSCSCFSHLF